MKYLTYFFILCSGANTALLEKCPGETARYASIGATVFFTGVFACISSAYAIYTVFDSALVSILFGMLWGLMIFNLDRYIVSSLKKERRWLKELLMASPRVVLAVLISVVIAKPLELKIFEKEIIPELNLLEQQSRADQENMVRIRFAAESLAINSGIALIKKNLEDKRRQRDEAMRVAEQEADGTGGSRIRNAGPIYQLKKRDADLLQQEYVSLQVQYSQPLEALQRNLLQNDSLLRAEIASLVFVKRNGLASRLEALASLEQKSHAIWLSGIFIMLLFISIETAPVVVKLISSRGPYDNLLNAEEFRFHAEETAAVALASADVRTSSSELPAEEKAFIAARLDKALSAQQTP